MSFLFFLLASLLLLLLLNLSFSLSLPPSLPHTFDGLGLNVHLEHGTLTVAQIRALSNLAQRVAYHAACHLSMMGWREEEGKG